MLTKNIFCKSKNTLQLVLEQNKKIIEMSKIHLTNKEE
jgi:hypothetical protein